eukprot:COSAG05_NODE_13010_length_445_cov_0.606936_1_plen_69_part_00
MASVKQILQVNLRASREETGWRKGRSDTIGGGGGDLVSVHRPQQRAAGHALGRGGLGLDLRQVRFDSI